MKTLRFLAICAIALFCNLPLWADTEVDSFCEFELNSGGSKPLMTWETTHLGDVIITLADGEGSTNTRFRGTGMGSQDRFYVVDAQKGNQKEAKNYFSSELKDNQFILHRKNVEWPEDGVYIKYYNFPIEWLCDENNNAAVTVSCYFPYGDICGTLAQPVVTDLQTDGTITFGAVQGATSYVARVYFDGEMLHEQSIVSGEKIYFNAYATGTHEVTVQAVSDNNYSKESVGTAWYLTGDIQYLPKSKFCGTDYMMTQPNVTTANAYVTIETKKGKDSAKDTVVFTISDATGSASPYACWRSNGLNQNGLLYDGKKFIDYFQLVENPDQKPMIQYVPNEGATVEFGKKITYNIGVNPQSAEWKTSQNINASANTMSFSYLYGTNCEEPIPPTPVDPESITISPASVSITEGQSTTLTATVLPATATDKSITWTSSDDDIATVDNGVVTGVSTGDVVITATSVAKGTVFATCSVTVTAPVMPTSVTLNHSAVSVAINGSLTLTATVLPADAANKSVTWSSSDENVATVADGVLTIKEKGTTTITATSVAVTSLSATCNVTVTDAQSEYCETTMKAAANGHPANFTWTTNAHGDIVITITPTAADEYVQWAGNGMGDGDAFRVGGEGSAGQTGKNYWTPSFSSDKSQYILTLKDNVTAPAVGTKIYFRSSTEVPFNYKPQGGTQQYAYGYIPFVYTYGSSCTFIPNQITLSQSEVEIYVSQSKTLTASVLPALATQTVVWSTSNEKVATVSNGTIVGVAEGTATIRATSTEAEGVYAECEVTIKAMPELDESEYCQEIMGTNNDAAIYTWETDNDGNVIITLQDAVDPTYNAVFRSFNEAFLGPILVNGVADTYFNKVGNNTNKFKLQLKDPNVMPAFGSTININGGVQINVKSNSNAAPVINFTYTYGSVCNVHLDEEKDNSPVLSFYNGQRKKVTLNRTFARDGYNYTLCLPFDMTAEQCVEAFGAGYKLYLLGNAYMKSDDMMYLPFNEVHAIEAGKPYIFCPAADVVNPTIEGVTINAAAPVAYPVVQGGALATMTGIYSPAVVAASNYVLGEENWLYQSNGDEMKGLRCYFTLTPSAATSNVRARAVFHNTDVVTDLETIDGSQCTMHDGKYVINGQFVIIRNNVRYNGMGQQVK